MTNDEKDDTVQFTPIIPDPVNPMDAALETITTSAHKWDRLQEDYRSAMNLVQESNDKIRTLSIQNEVLHKEVAHVRQYMGEELETMRAQRDAAVSYATEIRSRMSVIRENIIAADNVAMHNSEIST